MHKIVKIALIVLGVIGAILWTQLPDGDAPASEAVNNSAMNFMFVITYLLLGIAVLASLLFALKNLFSSPAKLKKALFSIGGFAVVALASYFVASGTDVDLAEMERLGNPTTEGTVKMIGGGLNLFFALVAIAVILMVIPGIKRVFNK
ncbi:hypothetical protein [Sediminicola luteus]|jgi:hypothetical protein|uniref:Uncharacterized protein n=1 Tax=Sediminicola luteus TaxID=319238 RepID=A0A2A4G2I9_9FLAO|nr:hypothetical protein [Sediminicola luteus]PCE63189.1 hypothetical protein B7P33_13240 [Sediminicola luteus]